MGPLAGRLLRVAPGEAGLAGGLALVMLLTSIGQGLGATAMDALLFARFGTERLPQLYLALGLVSVVVALGVSVLFAAMRRDRAYTVVLLLLVVVLVALYALVRTGADAAYPVAWLGANVVVMFQGIVGWGVASWLCDARQAKRLFPVANAAKIGGVVTGAALVPPLVAVLRLDDLLVLWAAAIAAALAVVWRMSRRAPVPPADRREVSIARELIVGFAVVRRSRLLRLLALSLVLFSVLFFTLALPFTRGARDTFPPEEQLASFLGLFNASTTAVAFLVSLFVANRVYARIGVVNAILVFTLIYLGGFVALVLTDSFVAVAAVRWLQLMWLAGIADSAYQALFNPLPAERRDQMRAFMEGVPGQAGIALAGLLLVVGDHAFGPTQVALGGVAAAALTTWTIWRIRGAYRDALVEALRLGRPEPFLGAEEAYAALLRDRDALDVLQDGLRSEDPLTRSAASEILADASRPRAAAPTLARAEETLGRGDVDAALGLFEQQPASRTSRALASLARTERERAARCVALAAAVATNGAAADLLRDSLTYRADAAARRAVRASAALSGRVAPLSLLDMLGRRDRRARAEALETLESYVRADLARPLVGIWESPAVADPRDLVHDGDAWLRDCASYLYGGDDMPITTVALVERVLFLRRVPLFAALDPADLQQIAGIATERVFVDGEVLAREGETGDALYLLVSGTVRVEQGGREVARRAAGDAIGEMSIVTASPRTATLIAAEPTRALRIGRADFESILRDRPETAIGVIRVLSARLVEATAARGA